MPDERVPPSFVGAAPVTHRKAPPAAVVIFGASGDLTRRRLLPAIRRLGHQARLIRGAAVVGVGRTPLSDGEFRGLIAEAGRHGEGGAVRYRTTPLFERIFGLTSVAELPALDDLAGGPEGLRERLEAVAAQRGA